LIGHALSVNRVRLYMDMQRPLTREELAEVRALLVRRRRREPVAYLRGKKEFYLHEFEVTRDVLIPRPETELLVDRALEVLSALSLSIGSPTGSPVGARALDLCTGSGAVAITLALQRPLLTVDATDLSHAALAVAARNVERHRVGERVHLHQGDLFSALTDRARYSLIVANPPYVAESDWDSLAPEITAHEPRMALIAPDEGLSVLRRIVADAADWLLPGGALLCELGRGQAPIVAEWLRADTRLTGVAVHKDLAGIERVVEAHAITA
jgi:release factor glutamine methyltransferase